MNRQPFERPPRWWSPKLSPRWVNFWRPFRKREQRKKHRLLQIDVTGAEIVRQLIDDDCGILITPNHPSHADSFALYEAADRVGSPIYAVVAWQVFDRGSWLRQQILRQHGAFSIDREGTDLTALRKAREILQGEPYPLVIFPEGEVYHLNDRITPFREGPAAVVLMAAKKSPRRIACVPCAIKYSYIEDPTEELTELMDRLELSLHWRPRTGMGLEERVYHLAEGIIALKEIEIVGRTSTGRLPDRIRDLISFVLGGIENRHELSNQNSTVPERVKAARRHLIGRLDDERNGVPERRALTDDLDDLFLVVQAYSYPGDYVSERPCIERIAETLDKFEEDLLGVATATIRGARRAVVRFGEPIVVEPGARRGRSGPQLTQELQDRVTTLLAN